MLVRHHIVLAVTSLISLLHGQFFVKAVGADHVGVNFVAHHLLEVDKATFFVSLFFVVFFIALFEQIKVLIGVTNHDVVTVK